MRRTSILTIALCLLVALPQAARADSIKKIAEALRHTYRCAFGKKNPHADCQPDVEHLAKEIDWLECLIESYGSVVPKQPDVWGEERLTKHRHEYEREIAKRFNSDTFDAGLQAAVRRSDQSLLALAFSINAASGGASVPQTTNAVSLITPTVPSAANPALPSAVVPSTPLAKYDPTHFANQTLSLEPTVVADELSRYLQHLNELRRVNEGDDTADSPGYALNLIRIPISVLPGHHTRNGYGTEITFTATPYLSDDLLPSTTRDLIINDIAEALTLPLAQLFNNDWQEAKSFLNDYWMQRARVARWLSAYDLIVTELQKEPELHQDVEYLRFLRSYLHFRFIQIAGQSERERDALTADTSHSKRVTGENACRLHTLADWGGTPLADLCPLWSFEFLDGFVVSVWAHQVADFFDQLSGKIENAEPQVPVRLAYCMNGGRPQAPFPAALFLKLVAAKDVKAGDFVNYRRFPFDIQVPDASAAKTSDEGGTSGSKGPDGVSSNLWKKLSTLASSYGSAFSYVQNPARMRDEAIKKAAPGLSYGNNISLALDLEGPAPGTMSDLFLQGVPAPAMPAGTRRNAPISSSQFWITYGFGPFMDVAYAAHGALRSNPANHPIVHVPDIEHYLALETRVAYEFLRRNENLPLWQFCTPELAKAVDTRNVAFLHTARKNFMDALGGHTTHTITAALAWAIVVDAARLNALLIDDMRSSTLAKGCPVIAAEGLQFTLPPELTSSEAHEAFRSYVQCRWPIVIFSLDPMIQQQNVADVFSRRRELQLAVSVAVANGEVSPSAAGRFVRSLETDMETVALNQTVVAFSHANDTFGWRFYPRVQTPETPGNLVAFGQTLFGGPSRDHDLRDRQLEPGTRECAAIVIMPSFVPYVTIKSRANWFCLTNPRKKELTLHDDMRISRTYQALHNAVHCTNNSNCYRPGDVGFLHDTLAQIERRMPLQQQRILVPYQNTLGGFDLFEKGVNGLGPQLTGWYGAPGIDPDGVTTMYLVGKRFNVLETRIIAGGRSVPFRMLSRNVLEVAIPPGTQPLGLGTYQTYSDRVDVLAAAPYGPSSHMLIPYVKKPQQHGANHYLWGTAAASVRVWYGPSSDGKSAVAQAVVADVSPQIKLSTPTISAPSPLTIGLTINEVQDGGELLLYNATVNARFDVRSQTYIIDGEQFNAFRSALMSTATNRLALLKPTEQPAHWLVRGWVTNSGGLPEPVAGSMAFKVTFETTPH